MILNNHLFWAIIKKEVNNVKIKRLLPIFAIIIIMLFASGCNTKKSEFKKQTIEYFAQYENVRQSAKCKTETIYSKNGAYAYQMPVTSSDADGKIKAFYDNAVVDFLKSSAEGDSLFISYRDYAASKYVGSIEVFLKQTLQNEVVLKTKTFNYDKLSGEPVSKQLASASIGQAKAIVCDVEAVFDSDGISYTDKTINVPYEQAGEKKVASIGFEYVYDYLPQSVQEKTEKTGVRVVDTNKKLVAVTFDDGPCIYTDDILDILEEYNSVATFFELGELLKYQEDAVKRADKMGCELASHTYSHKNLAKLNAEQIKTEIAKTDAEFKRILGKDVALVRPPYGSVSKTVLGATDKPMIGWSVDTLDWQSRNADKVVSVVKNEGNLDGDVILMHSLYPSTVEALKKLMPYFEKNGYQLVTMSELFKYKYNIVPATDKYHNASSFTVK